MLRARSPLFHFNPPHPPRPPPARVIRGAYTGEVRSYLTFSIKLLTFFWLDISLHFPQTLLRNAKLVRTAFPSFFSFPFFSFFFFQKTRVFFFFKVRGARLLASLHECSRRTQLYGLQSSLKSCSKI